MKTRDYKAEQAAALTQREAKRHDDDIDAAVEALAKALGVSADAVLEAVEGLR